jgi:acyl-CoA synthetase (AMP-forming)/AMP-acid ligase II
VALLVREAHAAVTAAACGKGGGNGEAPALCVGIFMPRSAAYVAAMLGTLLAGGAFVPVEVAYGDAALRHVLRVVQPTLLFVSQGTQERVPSDIPGWNRTVPPPPLSLPLKGLALPASGCPAPPLPPSMPSSIASPVHHGSGADADVSFVSAVGTASSGSVVSSGGVGVADEPLSADAAFRKEHDNMHRDMFIALSSGTTGQPKGGLHSSIASFSTHCSLLHLAPHSPLLQESLCLMLPPFTRTFGHSATFLHLTALGLGFSLFG